MALAGIRFAQNTPFHVGAKLLARDMAARQAFNDWAVLGGNTPAFIFPLADRRLAHAQS
jgi:hypothetical protein